MEDAYKPPQANLNNEHLKESEDYKLYSISGIGLATFFGSLFAGGEFCYRIIIKTLETKLEQKNHFVIRVS